MTTSPDNKRLHHSRFTESQIVGIMKEGELRPAVLASAHGSTSSLSGNIGLVDAGIRTMPLPVGVFSRLRFVSAFAMVAVRTGALVDLRLTRRSPILVDPVVHRPESTTRSTLLALPDSLPRRGPRNLPTTGDVVPQRRFLGKALVATGGTVLEESRTIRAPRASVRAH